jgi:hypothetical protein
MRQSGRKPVLYMVGRLVVISASRVLVTGVNLMRSEWVPDPYFGVFDRSIDAKRAFSVAMNPSFHSWTDVQIVRWFDSQARSKMALAKIVKVPVK